MVGVVYETISRRTTFTQGSLTFTGHTVVLRQQTRGVIHFDGRQSAFRHALYAITLDLEGATELEIMPPSTLRQPTADRGANDLPKDKPLFIARAAEDDIAG
jgi:hypothetical protein